MVVWLTRFTRNLGWKIKWEAAFSVYLFSFEIPHFEKRDLSVFFAPPAIRLYVTKIQGFGRHFRNVSPSTVASSTRVNSCTATDRYFSAPSQASITRKDLHIYRFISSRQTRDIYFSSSVYDNNDDEVFGSRGLQLNVTLSMLMRLSEIRCRSLECFRGFMWRKLITSYSNSFIRRENRD